MEKNSSLYTQHLSSADFDILCNVIYDYCGINITHKKKQMVEGRLRSRLRTLGLGTYSDYCDFVFRNGGFDDEIVHLVDSITTNKTEFFREPAHFSYLGSHLLPSLLQEGRQPMLRTLKIWSAACSTGQEPYSLALQLADFKRIHAHIDFQVLATDICTQVLEVAARAVYSAEAAGDIPEELKKRYLLKSKNARSKQVRIAPEIRKFVRFKRLNLNDRDYGIKWKVDIIFCRNVIIYFDTMTQETILRRLIQCLRKGGLLFLGHSEAIHGMDLSVRPIAPTIYERI